MPGSCGRVLAGGLLGDDLVVARRYVAAVLKLGFARGDGVVQAFEFVAGRGMRAVRGVHFLHARHAFGKERADRTCRARNAGGSRLVVGLGLDCLG